MIELSHPEAVPSAPASRRGNTAILVVPFLLVIVTFLFWRQTWFGRRLSDQEMDKFLTDTSVPHKTQHALAQLSERIAAGDQTARRWYPKLLDMARRPEPQFRLMAAWAMGQDNHSEEFHRALRTLVEDPEPQVRWNAALALVRFGDSGGESQLRSMLQSYVLRAPQTGTLRFRLRQKETLRSGSIVARIQPGEGAKAIDVTSPLDGELSGLLSKDGALVNAGDPLADLAPGETQVWEALRGLYLVGGPDALADVERFTRQVPGMPERIREQASLTAQAIRQRSTDAGPAAKSPAGDPP